MSVSTYAMRHDACDKPLVWLHGEVQSPPFSAAGRVEAGYLLRCLQRGDVLTMPASRPMPSIGERCHELRIGDEGVTWRIIYRLDRDAVVIVAVFAKKTAKMPRALIETCQRRLRKYDDACKQA